ncbi:hypothetical protein NOK12_29940 [Nocardioides sp. OK12]|nr:hypothetical protein NOK12_29940 [Nocardioides sp. OK12]
MVHGKTHSVDRVRAQLRPDIGRIAHYLAASSGSALNADQISASACPQRLRGRVSGTRNMQYPRSSFAHVMSGVFASGTMQCPRSSLGHVMSWLCCKPLEDRDGRAS